MKLEFDNEPDIKTIDEVVEELIDGGSIPDKYEVMGYELEYGCDLVIHVKDESGGSDDLVFYESDLRNEFSEAIYAAWAKNEAGESVLACFM